MDTSSGHYNSHQDRNNYNTNQIFEPFAELFEVNDDNYGWSSQSQNSEQFGSPVQCFLFHKVRGGKGEWKEISQGDMIRVTKGVGKKVKLVVRASFSFKIGELQLSLQDLSEGSKPSRVQENPKEKTSKFQIENTNMKQEGGRTTAEIFIKLFKLSKQLAFQISIIKDGGGQYHGHSSIFGTHNSGKQSKKKDKLDDKDERKRLEDEHMFERSRIGYDYSPMTQPFQKSLVNRSATAMKHFGNKIIAEEARKRNSSFVVYVACKKLKRPPEDFTTFIYKNEGLLHQEAVSLGTSMGRAIFLPPDNNGDYCGSYTLVAAIRSKGDSSDTIPPGEGVAALFDFRGENDSMKLIPIQPVLLSSEQTNVWLIGSFYIDGSDATWVQSSHLAPNQPMGMPQIVNSPMYHQPIHPTKLIQPDTSLYMSPPRQVYGPAPMGYPYQLNQPNKTYMIPPQYYIKQNESSGYPMYPPYLYPQTMSSPNEFRGTRIRFV